MILEVKENHSQNLTVGNPEKQNTILPMLQYSSQLKREDIIKNNTQAWWYAPVIQHSEG